MKKPPSTVRPKKVRRFSPLSDDRMTCLALWHHTLMIEATIPGLKGLAKYYFAQMDAHQRRLIDQFNKAIVETADAALAMQQILASDTESHPTPES